VTKTIRALENGICDRQAGISILTRPSSATTCDTSSCISQVQPPRRPPLLSPQHSHMCCWLGVRRPIGLCLAVVRSSWLPVLLKPRTQTH